MVVWDRSTIDETCLTVLYNDILRSITVHFGDEQSVIIPYTDSLSVVDLKERIEALREDHKKPVRFTIPPAKEAIVVPIHKS